MTTPPEAQTLARLAERLNAAVVGEIERDDFKPRLLCQALIAYAVAVAAPFAPTGSFADLARLLEQHINLHGGRIEKETTH